MPASRTRDPMDIGKLLEIYDDYPLVVRSLQATTDKLDRAEEVARKADARREQVEGELETEKKGRAADKKTAEQERDLALKTAKAEKEAAIKATDKKVREELDPRIAELEKKLKEMTTSRDTLQGQLTAWEKKLSGYATQMEKMHKEREAALKQDREAHEKRMTLADKLRTLDEEILESLKLEGKKPETPAEIKDSKDA